jgi:hypothetical protein
MCSKWSYLKEAEDVGDHDGDDAERGSDDARDRLVRHVHWGFARLALVLRHVLQQRNETVRQSLLDTWEKAFEYTTTRIHSLSLETTPGLFHITLASI